MRELNNNWSLVAKKYVVSRVMRIFVCGLWMNEVKRATAVLLVYGSGAIIVTLFLPLEEFQHLSFFSFSFPAMVIMGIGALLWWLGLVKEYIRYKRKR